MANGEIIVKSSLLYRRKTVQRQLLLLADLFFLKENKSILLIALNKLMIGSYKMACKTTITPTVDNFSFTDLQLWARNILHSSAVCYASSVST